MYSIKRRISEDKNTTTYILDIRDVCEEIFKNSFIGRNIIQEIRLYKYIVIYNLLVFVMLDTVTGNPVGVLIQINSNSFSSRLVLNRRKYKRYCTAFDIIKDIDQLKMTMNLLDDKSLDFLG